MDVVDEEELAAEALAAAPRDVPEEGAVSWWELTGQGHLDLLPAWYMPSPRLGSRAVTGWRRVLLLALVATLLLICAAGLCSTYGRVVPANL